jgi:hypothetical protein
VSSLARAIFVQAVELRHCTIGAKIRANPDGSPISSCIKGLPTTLKIEDKVLDDGKIVYVDVERQASAVRSGSRDEVVKWFRQITVNVSAGFRLPMLGIAWFRRFSILHPGSSACHPRGKTLRSRSTCEDVMASLKHIIDRTKSAYPVDAHSLLPHLRPKGNNFTLVTQIRRPVQSTWCLSS